MGGTGRGRARGGVRGGRRSTAESFAQIAPANEERNHECEEHHDSADEGDEETQVLLTLEHVVVVGVWYSRRPITCEGKEMSGDTCVTETEGGDEVSRETSGRVHQGSDDWFA